MDTELGRNLILWTVRTSVALYVLAGWRYLFHVRRNSPGDRLYQVLWAASWLMCVVHVICAFHFEHHWSHTAGLRHTAEMTERVVGVHWGGGLYINYIFLTVWGIDAVRCLGQNASTSSLAMHGVAVFMMFNATVIFGPPWWWIPFGIVMAAWLWKLRTAS